MIDGSAALYPVLVPLLAFAADLLWGEPPARLHPVVGMGCYLEWAGRRMAPDARSAPGGVARSFFLGTLAWSMGALGVGCLAFGIEKACLMLPVWLAVPVLAFCLKPLFAWSMLADMVAQVEAALEMGEVAGRERLAHLVSRDVQSLDATAIRESSIETLAENLSDSLVAPLFWFVLLGLPGCALYRFANTADAMWGYPGWHAGRYWQWAGKWAARADDVLNWLPARLTAALLMCGASLADGGRLMREARRTPSPNGGWPMAAMALRLGVSLGKPGVYRLNPSAPPPQAVHIAQALCRAQHVACLAVVLCAGAGVWLRGGL
ncbi:MAG: adenosylcobinamide-phosphate synthase CbiB [Lautropia sp.]|nr:adenosylcobinamide-phosphate synthase CbiB [Lautropia sp.]